VTGAEGPSTPCPVETCDRLFSSPNAAAQHAHRSGDHPDVETWEQAREMVESAEGNTAETEPTTGDDGGDDGGGDPLVGDAEPDAHEPVTCYKCGGTNLFDAREWTEYRYGCRDCSDTETWVVFDE